MTEDINQQSQDTNAALPAKTKLKRKHDRILPVQPSRELLDSDRPLYIEHLMWLANAGEKVVRNWWRRKGWLKPCKIGKKNSNTHSEYIKFMERLKKGELHDNW